MNHNLNKFDYYCFCVLSYIGGFGCFIAWIMAIWITEYRWQLFFTGIVLVLLNSVSEKAIRMFKDQTSKKGDK